jgi:hypothetical protein
LWETINGLEEKRAIHRWHEVPNLEREFTSDIPLEASGDLRPAMTAMVVELSGELKGMRMSCRKVEIMLSLEDGRLLKKILVMKQATAETKPILIRLCDFLEYLVLESPIRSCRLSIPDPVPLEGDQEGLFHKRSIFAERLAGIKAYLDACYGYTPIMRVEEREKRSRLPERRFRFTDV